MTVVGLGVLEGLIVTAAISLAIVIKRLSRPHVTVRDLDVESVDMLADLKVPLVNVHPQVAEMLSRRGSGDLVRRS